MKATRKTIPTLIEKREAFKNDSGTVRGIKNPSNYWLTATAYSSDLNETEQSRLRIDSDLHGISYVIMSYDTPIAWETLNGWVYKVQQELTQTSEQHKGLLFLFHQTEPTI